MKPRKRVRALCSPDTNITKGQIYEVTGYGCTYDGPTYYINGYQYYQCWFEDVED